MAKTVDEGFKQFHTWLTPTGTESEKAKNHRASIEACLKANFGMLRFFRTGSFGNGTSISSYSDVDYFASIPRKNLKQNSNITLAEIKNVLASRFPNTGVHIDSPAVVVPFGTEKSETTEIVPADFISRDGDYSTYEIPDGLGGWKRASPEYHKLYVDNRDAELEKKVKPLIRFMKAWKYYQSVPVSSFYLEMYTAAYAKTQTSIWYPIDLKILFNRLQALPSLEDPMAISGSIAACKTMADRIKALEKIKDAARRAENANKSEDKKDVSTAFYWWDKVYNDLFPSY